MRAAAIIVYTTIALTFVAAVAGGVFFGVTKPAPGSQYLRQLERSSSATSEKEHVERVEVVVVTP